MGNICDINTELKVLQCGTCGVWHAISEHMYKTCVEEGGYWYCPNGHNRGFSEGSIRNQLKREKELRKRAEKRVSIAYQEADKAERRRIAQKAATTRLANRAKAGVCPCCNRTFKQLAAHMKCKHPKYLVEER